MLRDCAIVGFSDFARDVVGGRMADMSGKREGMNRMKIRNALILALSINFAVAAATKDGVEKSDGNLLRNPAFEFHPLASVEDKTRSGAVACWNSDAWGDVEARRQPNGDVHPPAKFNAVMIKPGKRLWQFMTLPEIGCGNGDSLSLSVKGFQESGGALLAKLCVMRIESQGGTWSPKDFGCADSRTFQRHGRGELVRDPVKEVRSGPNGGEFNVKIEDLNVEGETKRTATASPSHDNLAGVLVEFKNVSTSAPVWIHSPSLTFGPKATGELNPTRGIPTFYRKIPRTIAKLVNGEPVHILTLGSSVDRGSANPRLYLYDEDPKSESFKQPLCDIRAFDPEMVGRPDLKGYVPWSQHYFMCVGRLRLSLLEKFNRPVNEFLLNVMATNGSSIGESHSGFSDYCEFRFPPSADTNGNEGESWLKLYPKLFEKGRPTPDLVVFGHGHNERIDAPDTAAAYEGAIRWFQRHYPDVEFVICMFRNEPENKGSPVYTHMPELAERYGIPYIDFPKICGGLQKTCNIFSLTPDGGHPQAATHYIWFKQLEQAFELPNKLEEGIEQRHLPERYNSYAYGWEGDMVQFKPGDPRLVGKAMIVEDCQFNIWVFIKKDQKRGGGKERVKFKARIDGEVKSKYAGNGYPNPGRLLRNSTLVYGRLSLGDRHIVEVVGPGAKIDCADCKVCPNRRFYPVTSPKWNGAKILSDFDSKWGAPYGDKVATLKPGDSLAIEARATDVSIAYVDQKDGGTLTVTVDGDEKRALKTNVPFIDADGNARYLENRKGVTGLPFGDHKVTVTASNGDVQLLGLFSYDTNTTQ